MKCTPDFEFMERALVAPPQERRRSQSVLKTDTCEVGLFYAVSNTRLFSAGSPPGYPIVAFPMKSVALNRSSQRDTLVADPTWIMFHNADSSRRREAIDPQGDLCFWLTVREDLVEQVLRRAGYETTSEDRPFPFEYGPCSRELFGIQRSLMRTVLRSWTGQPPLDERELETQLLAMFASAVQAAAAHQRALERRRLSRCPSRFLAEGALRFIAGHFASAPTVEDVARHLGCSRFHLARVFRSYTGRSVHSHRAELQLRSGYDRVVSTDRSLGEIAHELGFSSHSHFSARFRRAFGFPPSSLQKSREPLLTGLGPSSPEGDLQRLRNRVRGSFDSSSLCDGGAGAL